MPKTNTKMNEMKNGDVNFISLVKRGANRIPFRIIKSTQENQMSIDLQNLFRIKKAEAAVPMVASIIVNVGKDDTHESISAAVTAAGFDASKVSKSEDGLVTFAQCDVSDSEGQLVKLSDNVAVVMKGFSPYSEDLANSSDFNEIMATQGYYSNARTACDAIQSTISNAVYTSGSAQDARAMAGKAIDQFKTYILALIGGIPTKAFKAEKDIEQALATVLTAKTEAEKVAKSDDVIVVDVVVADPVVAPAVDTPAESQPVESAIVETPAAVVTSEADLVQKAAASVADTLSPILKQLTDTMNSITQSVDAIKSEQSKLSEQVTETAKKAEKVQEAVSNTVIAGASDSDALPVATVQKSDSDPRSGAFDTAFIKRNPR